jgi:signal peptidase II
MKKKILYWFAFIFSLILIFTDQIVKRWAFEFLEPVGDIPIIEGFIRFAYVENDGAAFGLFQGGRWFFIPLTVLISTGIVIFYAKLPYNKTSWKIRAPLLLIFAGAAGNFIDRILKGYVIDMFEFMFITFPVFNIADICLVTGTFALAVIMLFFVKEKS